MTAANIPLFAQQSSPADERVAEILARGKAVTPVEDDTVSRCPQPGPDNEIVVCGEWEDGDQYRAPGSPGSRRTAAEPPPAPDVAGSGIFRGPASFSGLCFIPPCPKEPAIIVDFSQIPEWDAEEMAREREAARLAGEQQHNPE